MEEIMAEAVAALAGQVKAPSKAPSEIPEGNAIAEAMAAVEDQITVAADKIPAGKTVVAVELERDPAKSGRFIVAIDPHWMVTGKAVAIKDGHVLAANFIFGRYTNSVPKVSACHFVTCTRCAKRVLMPTAVWEAKDMARKQGIEVPKEVPGMQVLREHGHCSCGGKWAIDEAEEKAAMTTFADKVLKAISTNAGPVPAFVMPAAFTVTPLTGSPAPIQGWDWLTAAMAKAGKAVRPFDAKLRGDTVMFNPGFWLGHISDHNSTGLFWVEDGKNKGGSRAPKFNPCGVDGL